eukprot:TRINITY_DN305_c0_g1_i1.p1 TRINITY_DN305_c0_g1~~TRINITY_DN305_c0_g1_i1.p1  ORF type:complete len:228 (-),score=51.70 TRINITY_DN305_c0_g1_i1:167-850(-)
MDPTFNVYRVHISQWIASALSKQHSELCFIYRNFLTKFLDGGYFTLWLEVDNFKNMQSNDENQIRLLASELYERYWSPNSDYAIHIKPKIKEQLARDIASGNVTVTIFDEALKELESESYKKFLRSDIYAGFMADKGVFVRTASPKRRVSITELFKKKGPEARRRSSLGVSAWTAAQQQAVQDAVVDHEEDEDERMEDSFSLDGAHVNSLGNFDRIAEEEEEEVFAL